jgi:hypothetical protein
LLALVSLTLSPKQRVLSRWPRTPITIRRLPPPKRR